VPAPIQELRDLTRTRKQLMREIGRHTLRIQKTLEDANLKVTRVVSDILGASGRDGRGLGGLPLKNRKRFASPRSARNASASKAPTSPPHAHRAALSFGESLVPATRAPDQSDPDRPEIGAFRAPTVSCDYVPASRGSFATLGRCSSVAKHFGNYDEWKLAVLECPRCGWK
jgi:hypothetical protein